MSCFAIVPAAGLGKRMGGQKLLLPWGQDTVIGATLSAWLASRVDRVVLITRTDCDQIIKTGRSLGANVVEVSDCPPDMKASVSIGLRYLDEKVHPGDGDAWLLAPADLPWLSVNVINRLVAEHATCDFHRILVPVHAGRRGHPVLFPWNVVARVNELGPDEGINALLDAEPTEEIGPCDETILGDLDTTPDYRAAIAKYLPS